MHRAGMGAPELQSNAPEMRKTSGNTGFYSMGLNTLKERTETVQPIKSRGTGSFITMRDAKYDALRIQTIETTQNSSHRSQTATLL